jgi:ABC-type glycerol-3-phosphate transport system permease component
MVKRPPSFLPETWTLQNYVDLLYITEISRNFLNSFIVATFVAITTIIAAGLGAYRLSRTTSKIVNYVKTFLYTTYIFPPIMLALSMVRIFAIFGLYNTFIGIMLAHLTITLPYATLLLWPFFTGIPKELDEAAQLDGASKMRTLFSIILPAVLPGIISVGLFSFIMSWNDFTYALFLLRSDAVKTAPLKISDYMLQEGGFPWKWVLPSLVITTFPALIAYALLEERLIKGFGFTT